MLPGGYPDRLSLPSFALGLVRWSVTHVALPLTLGDADTTFLYKLGAPTVVMHTVIHALISTDSN